MGNNVFPIKSTYQEKDEKNGIFLRPSFINDPSSPTEETPDPEVGGRDMC